MTEPQKAKPFSSALLVRCESQPYDFRATAREDGTICIEADNGCEAYTRFTPQQVLDIAVNLIGLVSLMQQEFSATPQRLFDYDVFCNLTGRDPADDGTEYAWLDYLGD